jgi:hypothetical protein
MSTQGSVHKWWEQLVHNGSELQTVSMFIWCTDKWMWYVCIVEYCSAVKKNVELMHTTPWTNLENMLGLGCSSVVECLPTTQKGPERERERMQKKSSAMKCLLIWNVQHRQIYGDRRLVDSRLGMEVGMKANWKWVWAICWAIKNVLKFNYDNQKLTKIHTSIFLKLYYVTSKLCFDKVLKNHIKKEHHRCKIEGENELPK